MPGGELATVLVRLTADASDFIAVMDTSIDRLNTLSKAAAAVTGAGLLVAGGLVAATESAAKYEAEIFNLNKQTGISTELLSAMGAAAEAQGRSLDSVQVAMRKLGQEVENALISPYSKAAGIFQDLGVKLTDNSGKVRTLQQVFQDSSNSLSTWADSAAKTGVESDLFGRSSIQLNQVLASGMGVLANWGTVAQETGTLVTDQIAQQGKAFLLMQQEVEMSLRGVEMAVASILLPSMMDMAKSIETGLNSFRNFINANPAFVAGLVLISATLLGVGGTVLAVTQLAKAFESLGIASALTGVLNDLKIALGATGVAAGSADIALAPFLGTIGALAAVTYLFRDSLSEVTLWIGSKLASALAAILGPLGTLAGTWIPGVSSGFEGLKDSIMEAKFSLEESSKNWQDQSDQFSHNTTFANDLSQALQDLLRTFNKNNQGLKDGTLTNDDFRRSVDRLKDSVTEEIKQGPVLMETLIELSNARVNDGVIIDKLGTKILAYGDLQIKQKGDILDPILKYYYDLATQKLVDISNTERQFDVADKMGEAIIKNNYALAQYVIDGGNADKVLQTMTRDWDAGYKIVGQGITDVLKMTRDSAKSQMDIIQEELAGDTTYHSKLRDLNAGTVQFKIAADNAYADFKRAYDTLLLMDDGKFAADEVQQQKDLVDQRMKVYAGFYNDYLKLNDQTIKTNTDYWKHFYESQDQANEKMEFAMEDAMGNVSKDLATNITDMIFKGKSFSDAMTDIFQNMATKMMDAFLEGLFNPMTNALKQLGKSISDWASQATNDVAGVSSGMGSLGSLLTGGLIAGGIAVGASLLGKLFGGSDPKYTNWTLTQPGVPGSFLQETTGPMTAKDGESYWSGRGLQVVGYYDKGTDYVPRTGPAIVHQGESIMSAGGTARMTDLLTQILDAVSNPGDIILQVDGQELGRVSGLGQRFMTYNYGLKTVAAR